MPISHSPAACDEPTLSLWLRGFCASGQNIQLLILIALQKTLRHQSQTQPDWQLCARSGCFVVSLHPQL